MSIPRRSSASAAVALTLLAALDPGCVQAGSRSAVRRDAAPAPRAGRPTPTLHPRLPLRAALVADLHRPARRLAEDAGLQGRRPPLRLHPRLRVRSPRVHRRRREPASRLAAQSMPDPRLPIVETTLDRTGRQGAPPLERPGRRPRRRPKAADAAAGRGADEAKPPRGDLLLVRKAPGAHRLALTVESKDALDVVDRAVLRGGRRFASFSARWDGIVPGRGRITILFPARVEELAVYCASGHDAGDVDPAWAKAQPERAARWWAGRDFPYGVLSVPDPALQGLIDSCIRNIYQAREIKDGLPIFQVGPTCYRGLLGRGRRLHPGGHDLPRPRPGGSGRHPPSPHPPEAGRIVRRAGELLEGERHRPLYPEPARPPDRGRRLAQGELDRGRSAWSRPSSACAARAARIPPRPKPGSSRPACPTAASAASSRNTPTSTGTWPG